MDSATNWATPDAACLPDGLCGWVLVCVSLCPCCPPPAGLAALEVLDLSHNAVSDPDMLPYLADCPALAALDLSANPARFTQQQVSHCPAAPCECMPWQT